MRTYEVSVRVRPNRKEITHWQEVVSYVCESKLNIRAVVILLFHKHFGAAPKMHWAESGSLCMGQAWDTKRCTRALYEVEVFQQNRMHTAYAEARTIIWNAKLPRLMEGRAA